MSCYDHAACVGVTGETARTGGGDPWVPVCELGARRGNGVLDGCAIRHGHHLEPGSRSGGAVNLAGRSHNDSLLPTLRRTASRGVHALWWTAIACLPHPYCARMWSAAVLDVSRPARSSFSGSRSPKTAVDKVLSMWADKPLPGGAGCLRAAGGGGFSDAFAS